MSELSYMEKLLDGVEVEWKELGEVCRFINGKAYKRPELLEKGKYPVLRVGNFFTNDNWYYSNLELHEDKYCDDGDLLYAWSASFGPRIWEGGKVIYHYHIWKVIPETEIISKKYLFYLLDWDTEALKAEHGTGSTMMHVGKGAIEKRIVPIPPLNVQAEIVRILDAFTELTAELTAELISRKQQHAYYLENLLSFNDNKTKWKTLGEVTLSTSNIKWRDTDSAYRYIDLSSVSRENNSIIETSEITAENAPSRAQKLVIEDDIIFATTRPTQQRLCLINNEYSGEIASTGYCVLRAKPDVVLPKWIYFYLSSTKFRNYVEEVQSGAAYPAVSDTKVKNFNFPIPSLAEQERIITILDKFDALTTDVLPREIALRQQQYEYYRELLLSFPKAEVTDHD